MNFEQVETEVKKLSKKIKKESFVYDFLAAFGTAKSTITMLKNGSRNLSKNKNEIICKKKILFLSVEDNVEENFEEVVSDKSAFKHDPRFIVVTDHKDLFALDTKLMGRIDFKVKDIHKKFDFFLPLAGIEKKEFQHENPVDVKAAEKLAKLFDLIKADNPKSDEKSLHSLNVFLTRLLFCYFAEDTDIFPSGLFSRNVASHTQPDGSDLSSYLKRLFAIMNIEARPKDLPDYIAAFPYVNGGLFAETHPIPKFSKKSRAVLLDVADLDWAEINPDIFGSMIQAVVHPDQRAGLGMHYTSVSNIMKVIEPLFLNDLYEELDKCKKSATKLKKLLKRISEIKIFDPACGSGNFLIIAYKELRKLEMKVYSQLPNEMKFSYIPLSNFCGIEIDDFAHEVAILSLWLTQHQMDVKFYEEFGTVKASLPLKDGGNVIQGNALRLDWKEICKNEKGEEVYILGNPPYVGSRMQTKEQKSDMDLVFSGFKSCRDLDYVSCWLYKASEYIKSGKAECMYSFVTTNSIFQGTQISTLSPKILKDNLEIKFAYTSFKWTNNAKNKAGVTCCIVGVGQSSNRKKYIYSDGRVKEVNFINSYLSTGSCVIVEKRKKPLADIPIMLAGNYTGHALPLSLSDEEKTSFLEKNPSGEKFIKKLLGADEFLKGKKRWCLWIRDEDLDEALKILDIKERVEKVKDARLKSKDPSANKLASRPHQYRDILETKSYSLLVPTVSSELRKYIPVGFINNDTIITNRAMVVYDCSPVIFGIVSSLMHMSWVRLVSGKLETRICYSNVLCYNTFPFPEISNEQQQHIIELVYGVIEAREAHADKTLSQLYDSKKMPAKLINAHQALDDFVDSCYRQDRFDSHEERVEFLLKRYEKLIPNN